MPQRDALLLLSLRGRASWSSAAHCTSVWRREAPSQVRSRYDYVRDQLGSPQVSAGRELPTKRHHDVLDERRPVEPESRTADEDRYRSPLLLT